MRIALVTETYPPEVNGVAMTLQRLCYGLADRKHMIQVIRPRQKQWDVQRIENGIEELPLPGLPLPGYDGLHFGLPAIGTLVENWRSRRPDVVHVATEGPLGWSGIRAAKRLGIPLASSFHTNFHTGNTTDSGRCNKLLSGICATYTTLLSAHWPPPKMLWMPLRRMDFKTSASSGAVSIRGFLVLPRETPH